MFKKYLINLVVALSFITASILAFNWVINPYQLWQGISFNMNATKPSLDHRRFKVATALREQRPQSIILGSSRAQYGLSTQHPKWQHQPVINSAFEQATMFEIYQYFKHATNVSDLKQVVLGLDFYTFNAYLEPVSDYNDSYLDVESSQSSWGKKVEAMISLDGLKASVKTLTANLFPKPLLIKEHNLEKNVAGLNIKDKFRAVEKGFLDANVFYPLPHKQFSFTSTQKEKQPLDYLEMIIKTCKEQDIDLVLFVSPTHARMQELIAALDLWDSYEHWKKALVKITSQYPNITLYDFSGYDPIHTEDVASLPEDSQSATWFYESSHYHVDFGNIILDKILDPSQKNTPGIGRILSAENIERHLEQGRLAQKAYRQSHGLDILEIKKIAQRA